MSDELLKKILTKVENIEKILTKVENIEPILQKELINESKSGGKYVFEDNRETHNVLLEKLLKSDFCFSKEGLTQDEIFQIFKENKRPVNPEKIKALLRVWKNRKKIEGVERDKILRYFWNHSKTSKRKTK